MTLSLVSNPRVSQKHRHWGPSLASPGTTFQRATSVLGRYSGGLSYTTVSSVLGLSTLCPR